jgi:hypothetical protein
MTEIVKKTFSTKTDNGSLQYGSGIYFYNGNEFPADEWDMEVTFTKKVRIEVGGTATVENYTTVFTIIAISDGRAWLQDPNNQAQNFVRRFDQLQNVKPWQPA